MKSYNVEESWSERRNGATPLWNLLKDFSSPSLQVKVSKANSNFGRYDNLKIDPVTTDMTTSVVPTAGHFVQRTDSLHAALKSIITLAQCFAVFPVSGVHKPDASYLKFTWRSFKILYCCLSTLSSLALAICSLLRLISTGITSPKLTTLVFMSTSCVTNLLFLRLAMNWPKFASAWEKIERELAPRHRRVSNLSLATRFKIITTAIMTLALLEHALSIVSGYVSALNCASLRGDIDIVATYFQTQFPQVFSRTPYALWKGIVVQSSNVLSTFTWNFMDLFLILISIALTDQFHQLNNRLHSIREKNCLIVKSMPEWWWAEARNDYNRLATLTRRVDAYISGIVLLSFGTNLWFICIQLLNSFKYLSKKVQLFVILIFERWFVS